MNKKLLIIGHARHGKDTAAEILAEKFGLTFKSSSELAAEIFIYDLLKDKYGYNSFQECYEDRVNHRAEWYELIKEYNSKDRTKLAKEIVSKSNGYVGMRELEEINKCREEKIFDHIIWIDALKRLPLENKDSFNITVELADIIIFNNDSLEQFKKDIEDLYYFITKDTEKINRIEFNSNHNIQLVPEYLKHKLFQYIIDNESPRVATLNLITDIIIKLKRNSNLSLLDIITGD